MIVLYSVLYDKEESMESDCDEAKW